MDPDDLDPADEDALDEFRAALEQVDPAPEELRQAAIDAYQTHHPGAQA